MQLIVIKFEQAAVQTQLFKEKKEILSVLEKKINLTQPGDTRYRQYRSLPSVDDILFAYRPTVSGCKGVLLVIPRLEPVSSNS